MARITPDAPAGLPPSLDNVGVGHEVGDPGGQAAAESGGRSREEAYARLGDLLDRVHRHSHRPGGAARLASPAPASKKDPTKLPEAADCRRSFAAIAAAGFTDVHLRPVPYFNQGVSPWAGHAYPRNPPVPGESRTIKDAGCAPTALAMIDCGLRDAHTRPIDTADFAVSKGVSGTRGQAGSDTDNLARKWAAAHGLDLTAATSNNQSRNVGVLKAGLQANGIALVSVGIDAATKRGHFTSGGHVIVINGYARRGGEDWFAVANPGRADQADASRHKGLLTTDDNVMQVDSAHHGVGQVWISRTQLVAEMKRCFVFRSGAES
jgi:hypothetical protein